MNTLHSVPNWSVSNLHKNSKGFFSSVCQFPTCLPWSSDILNLERPVCSKSWFSNIVPCSFSLVASFIQTLGACSVIFASLVASYLARVILYFAAQKYNTPEEFRTWINKPKFVFPTEKMNERFFSFLRSTFSFKISTQEREVTTLRK